MAQDKGQALGWEDESTVQDNGFEILPEGEYAYEVVSLKRERFDGSAKMNACPVAALQLRCADGNGVIRTGFCRLFLNSKVLWRITEFFKSCGLVAPDAPEGTSMPMSLFDQVIGCTGYVKVTVSTSERDGKTYENNDYKFLKPTPKPMPPQAQPQQQSWGGQGF